MNKTKIGLPKGLLYYKYHILWETFFNKLGIETIESKDTDREIIENGNKLTVDEACLSLKIFIGHVNYLIDKVDYILIPRVVSLKKGEKLCTNFYALYDIVNNTFKANILDYNIDVDKNITEVDAFLDIGRKLGFSKCETMDAYYFAKKEMYKQNKISYIKEKRKLNSSKLKILIVSHPYNINDNYVGKSIQKIIKELDCEIIKADIYNPDINRDLYKNISKSLYFTYSIELLNMIEEYKNKIDGIILLSAFPCGPDSLVNELIIRKINKPLITIVIDDISSFEGYKTRIESFIDIIGGKDFEKSN